MEGHHPDAVIVIVGDEVLSGQVIDRNSHFLASELNKLGILTRAIFVIPDDMDTIVSRIRESSREYGYVFVCGGIGPTPDDKTRQAVASAFNLPCTSHPEAKKRLLDYYKEKINPSRLNMADLPLGAILIDNPITVAPGFIVENVFVFPGFPNMVEAMFLLIKDRLPSLPHYELEIITLVYEGDYTPLMEEVTQRFPDVSIGSYPSKESGRWENKLIFKGRDKDRVDLAKTQMEEGLKKIQTAHLGINPRAL